MNPQFDVSAASDGNAVTHPVASEPSPRLIQTLPQPGGLPREKRNRQSPMPATWPSGVARECKEIWRAMRPRSAVELYIPDRDIDGSLIDVTTIAEELRVQINAICGGQFAFLGSGDYIGASSIPMPREETTVIRTFLPAELHESCRLRLIRLFVDFGCKTRQETVLVAVENRGFFIPTGQMINRAA